MKVAYARSQHWMLESVSSKHLIFGSTQRRTKVVGLPQLNFTSTMGTGGIILSFARSLNTSNNDSEESTKPCQPSLRLLSMLEDASQHLLGMSRHSTGCVPEIHRRSTTDKSIQEREDSINVPQLLFNKVILVCQFFPSLSYFRPLCPLRHRIFEAKFRYWSISARLDQQQTIKERQNGAVRTLAAADHIVTGSLYTSHSDPERQTLYHTIQQSLATSSPMRKRCCHRR